MYKLESTSSDRWIFISAEYSLDEPDAFIAFVKEYQSQFGGKIAKASDDTQYKITNDPLKLIFQWDDLFGIIVIVPHEIKLSTAENAMQMLCNVLNDRISK